MPRVRPWKGRELALQNHQAAPTLALALWYGASFRTLGTGNGSSDILRCVSCTSNRRSIRNISTMLYKTVISSRHEVYIVGLV